MSGTTTNRAISSHDEGPNARKPKIEDQGPEQKAANKNPNRDNAADRVDEFIEDAKTDPAKSAALANRKASLPDKGNVQPSDDAANIPVSEVAAGIEPPEFSQGPAVSTHQSNVLGPDPAFGDPDSIAAWERRHAEEAKLRKENK